MTSSPSWTAPARARARPSSARAVTGGRGVGRAGQGHPGDGGRRVARSAGPRRPGRTSGLGQPGQIGGQGLRGPQPSALRRPPGGRLAATTVPAGRTRKRAEKTSPRRASTTGTRSRPSAAPDPATAWARTSRQVAVTTGRSRAKERALTVPTPTRSPVKRPGPTSTAEGVEVGQGHPDPAAEGLDGRGDGLGVPAAPGHDDGAEGPVVVGQGHAGGVGGRLDGQDEHGPSPRAGAAGRTAPSAVTAHRHGAPGVTRPGPTGGDGAGRPGPAPRRPGLGSPSGPRRPGRAPVAGVGGHGGR